MLSDGIRRYVASFCRQRHQLVEYPFLRQETHGVDVDKIRESGRTAKDVCSMNVHFSRAEIYKVVFQIQTGETWRVGRDHLNGEGYMPIGGRIFSRRSRRYKLTGSFSEKRERISGWRGCLRAGHRNEPAVV